MGFDESSGISADDQKEILVHIDQVVKENKITVTPEVFRINALKKGFLFPALVNVFTLIVLAAGIFTFAMLFRQGEEKLQEAGTVTTAESKLIRELKRESEEKLLEKNKEHVRIQY